MERSALLFATLFVALPLAFFAGAMLAPAYSVLLALVGLVILTFGFTLGVILVPT